jgi:hypothetical protein
MSRAFPVSIPHGPSRAYASPAAVLLHAAGHARNRLLHTCEAVSWIGGLALQSQDGHVPAFSIAGAKVQDATANSGEQAAHVLPGQILINGKPPWAFAGGESARVAWLSRFMVTSAVPEPFNVADSSAEKAGLKEAFRQACERAWSATVAGRATLSPVYEFLLEDADLAFQKAERGKQSKRASASADGDSRTGDERFVESLILRMYRLHGVTAGEANRLFPPVQRKP